MSFWEVIGAYITGGSLLQVLEWWVVLFVIGILFHPISVRLFDRFFDYGYAFSKIMGLISAVYITWLAASLRFAAFSQATCLFAVVIIAFVGAAATYKTKYCKTVLDTHKIILAEELMFLGALIVWGFIRSLHPDIHGLEKFMDYGFMTSILNSSHMPPTDPWLSGHTINYYYFGHFTYAWLAKLSGMYPPVAYNLSIATLFALSFSLVHSLTANMVYLRKDCTHKVHHAAGLISAVLFTLGGNLYTATYGFALPVLKFFGIYHGSLSSNYAIATRFVGSFPPTSDKLITEFPAYSYVVADLHAHVMSVPLVLTLLGLCLVSMQATFDNRDGTRRSLAHFLWMSLIVAASSLTNSWTLPTCILSICVVSGIARFRKTNKPMQGAMAFILSGFVVGLITAILTLPFQMHFKNFCHGIRFSDAHTPFWQLLILWGYQVVTALWYAFALYTNKKKNVNRITASDYIAISFVVCAFVFIAIPEVVYIKDIYNYPFRRANTVFKLSYEAFILLTVITGYFAVLIGNRLTVPSQRLIVVVGLIMVLYLPMTYTWLSLMQGCTLPDKPRYVGLDGLAFMLSINPSDFKAANWLQKNTSHNAIILEADGDSYTDYARISMMSGHPTVLGWYVHEWLWRGGNRTVQNRKKDIQNIYETTNSIYAAQLLRKYNVSYIVVGMLEEKRYPRISRLMLMKLGKTVFESEHTVIINVTEN